MIPKRGNNQGAASCPSESSHAVEQAFLRLGDVLSEVAEDVARRKTHSNQDMVKNYISSKRIKKKGLKGRGGRRQANHPRGDRNGPLSVFSRSPSP